MSIIIQSNASINLLYNMKSSFSKTRSPYLALALETHVFFLEWCLSHFGGENKYIIHAYIYIIHERIYIIHIYMWIIYIYNTHIYTYMTFFPTQSLYPDAGATSPCPILVIPSARLGIAKYQLCKSLVWFGWNQAVILTPKFLHQKP